MPVNVPDNIKDLVAQVMTERVIKDSIGFYTGNYSPHSPYERQILFLELKTEKEVFYGGAAGGGKSDALLMAALEYVHIPGYAALLLRRTYADLAMPGALMDRAKGWLQNSDAHWSDKEKTYTFPSGATITFGYLDSENDKFRYQSSEFQFIGFDELSQFTETQYTYLFSRLRRKVGVNVPLRMRAGSNPGGIGGNWVKSRFIPEDFIPEMAEQPRVFEKTYVDEETGEHKVRFFVPARLDDNPFIDQEAYDESLKELDPITRAQLRRGDWSITAKGDILYMWSEAHTVVTWSRFMQVLGLRSKDIPPHWQVSVYQDWGTTKGHPCVTGWFARFAENSPEINGVKTAGLIVWYRTHIRTQCSAKTLKDDIFNYMLGPDQKRVEYYQATDWQMSHEANSERIEYNTPDPETNLHLPFSNWKTGKTRGIEPLKTALTPCELDKPHPFNLGVMGHTKLIILVDDDQYINPRVMLDGLDGGQSRIRAEAPLYKWDAPKSGEPAKKLEPYALFNDALDVARAAAASYWPAATELTERELEHQEMKKSMPWLKNIDLQRRDENGEFTDKVYLTVGQQIAIGIEAARARKRVQEEYGLEDNDTILDYTDLSKGW